MNRSLYGRDEFEWDELRTAAIDFLRERARMERTTSYTELNTVLARRTGHQPFDFSTDRDRAAMGQLLGECTKATYGELGVVSPDSPGRFTPLVRVF